LLLIPFIPFISVEKKQINRDEGDAHGPQVAYRNQARGPATPVLLLGFTVPRGPGVNGIRSGLKPLRWGVPLLNIAVHRGSSLAEIPLWR